MCLKMKMSTPSVPQVQTTARELVPETTSNEPDAPIFGGNASFNPDKKVKGKEALKINRVIPTNSPFTQDQRMVNF